MAIYLDHQATTPVSDQVLSYMKPFWQKDFGNPHSSEHAVGWQANKEVELSKLKIAQTLHCEKDEIIFYSGATEANNHAIFAFSTLSKELKNKRQVIVSSIEHKCVLEAATYWSENFKLDLKVVRTTESGSIDLEHLSALLQVPTLYCSIMFVNNEIGTIQDLKTISRLVRDAGAYLHSDCAQVLKTLRIEELTQFVDIATFSGHKIGGPQGIGCAFIASDFQNIMTPLAFGGGQQSGLRSGTLPLPLVAGLGEAFLIYKDEDANISEIKKTAFIRDKFWKDLKKLIPTIELNGPTLKTRHVGNLNIFFPGIEASDLIMALQPHIALSSGAACSSGSIEQSYVIDALQQGHKRAISSVRVSFCSSHTKDQLSEVPNIIAKKYFELLNLID